MRLRLLAVLASASAALLGASCDEPCTAVYAADGFDLSIARPAWEPAAYRFEGHVDGAPFSCDLDRNGTGSCAGALFFEALEPAGAEPRVTLRFPVNPRRVELEVRRDGELLGADTFTPEYVTDEPNGEGCGERTYAEATMTLPGPAPCWTDGGCRCVRDDECGCDQDDQGDAAWSACPAGTIPRTACEPSRCGCAMPAPFECRTACDHDAAWLRASCVDGAWACPDAFPVRSDECV